MGCTGAPICVQWQPLYEFLTEETIYINELSKKTTYQKNYQKRPSLSGGTSGQATRVACRLGQSRQAHAACPNAGMSPDRRRRRPPFPLVGPAA
jgi:hypothetical protein